MTTENVIQIPAIVDIKKDGSASIFIPGIDITVHGTDFADGLAKASLRGGAIYFYCKERNIDISLITSYEDVVNICIENHSKNAFVAYIRFIS